MIRLLFRRYVSQIFYAVLLVLRATKQGVMIFTDLPIFPAYNLYLQY